MPTCPLCRQPYESGIACNKCWHALPGRLSSLLAHTRWGQRSDHRPYLDALAEARQWLDERRNFWWLNSKDRT